MADSIGNKTALLYGLFNWQQNGLTIWLIPLTTERSYYVADSIDSKMALLYGLFNWQQNGQQNGLIIWLIQLTTKWL